MGDAGIEAFEFDGFTGELRDLLEQIYLLADMLLYDETDDIQGRGIALRLLYRARLALLP